MLLNVKHPSLRRNYYFEIVFGQLYSTPRYLSSTFEWFFFKIHILVKELQLNEMKGNISKLISFTRYHFLIGKFHRNDNWFLTDAYYGECWNLVSIRKSSGDLAVYFNVIVRVCCSTISSYALHFQSCIEPW